MATRYPGACCGGKTAYAQEPQSEALGAGKHSRPGASPGLRWLILNQGGGGPRASMTADVLLLGARRRTR